MKPNAPASRVACPICSAAMNPDLLPATWHCRECSFLTSDLPVTINQADRIDEVARERALKPIRTANFRSLLDNCADLLPAGATLLDVGCAHGWFMEEATARGLVCTGVEPDHAMAAHAVAQGHRVLQGFFPDVVPPGDQFDVITFNDVLEHLPDVNGIARDLGRHLVPGGLVIVNLPVADGLIFRTARLAARVGLTGPLARMWQYGLPSPHLSYFNRCTLPRLFERAGFELVRQCALQSVEKEGLYDRIRYDRSVGTGKAVALYAAARVMRLATGIFPSDIQCFVFRK